MNDDKFNVKMNIDPNLKPDTTLKMGDNDFTYSEISDMFKIHNHSPIRLLVYWDDMCQYTSIGLIEVINALLETNAKTDLEHFFTRPNEYCYGIQYVYRLFENVLKPDQINKIKKQYYWKVMQLSLKSMLFTSITKISSFIDRIGFYFPYKFENSDNLRIGFFESYFNNKPMENIQFYYAENGTSFNKLIQLHGYNSVITPDIKATYDFIINNDLKQISMLSSEDHNGITPEMYELFMKFKGLPMPNYCSIHLFKEQIYL